MHSKKFLGRVYTVAYLSERWNWSTSKIKRKIVVNELKAQKIGKTWYISHTVVKHFEKKNIPPAVITEFKKFVRMGKRIADVEKFGTVAEKLLLSEVATVVSRNRKEKLSDW